MLPEKRKNDGPPAGEQPPKRVASGSGVNTASSRNSRPSETQHASPEASTSTVRPQPWGLKPFVSRPHGIATTRPVKRTREEKARQRHSSPESSDAPPTLSALSRKKPKPATQSRKAVSKPRRPAESLNTSSRRRTIADPSSLRMNKSSNKPMPRRASTSQNRDIVEISSSDDDITARPTKLPPKKPAEVIDLCDTDEEVPPRKSADARDVTKDFGLIDLTSDNEVVENTPPPRSIPLTVRRPNSKAPRAPQVEDKLSNGPAKNSTSSRATLTQVAPEGKTILNYFSPVPTSPARSARFSTPFNAASSVRPATRSAGDSSNTSSPTPTTEILVPDDQPFRPSPVPADVTHPLRKPALDSVRNVTKDLFGSQHRPPVVPVTVLPPGNGQQDSPPAPESSASAELNVEQSIDEVSMQLDENLAIIGDSGAMDVDVPGEGFDIRPDQAADIDVQDEPAISLSPPADIDSQPGPAAVLDPQQVEDINIYSEPVFVPDSDSTANVVPSSEAVEQSLLYYHEASDDEPILEYVDDPNPPLYDEDTNSEDSQLLSDLPVEANGTPHQQPPLSQHEEPLAQRPTTPSHPDRLSISVVEEEALVDAAVSELALVDELKLPSIASGTPIPSERQSRPCSPASPAGSKGSIHDSQNAEQHHIRHATPASSSQTPPPVPHDDHLVAHKSPASATELPVVKEAPWYPVPDIIYPERPRSPLNYAGTTWTWEDTKKDLSNFKRPVYYAKNLPHAFQDHINSLGKSFLQNRGLQICFEGMIRENTSFDEPHAPLIKVKNNVDDEATPPWEFHYSNHMWLGEGVPPPDLTKLVGCDCIGACNPNSKTCACVQRQKRYSEDNPGFAYDKSGKLKLEEGYPIFECNDLCLCDDHCTNRVVQHGRKCEVEIIKTLNKGWGVFAGKNRIRKGTFIGVYAGELLTDDEGDKRGCYYNKFGRTYLFNIDFHHLKGDNPDTWENQYVVDAYHAGNFTRFLNHSCQPNCVLYSVYINDSNIDLPLLTIFALRDIEAEEELCFSYSGPPDEADLAERRVEADTVNLKNDAIYTECRCGAPRCTKIMFK